MRADAGAALPERSRCRQDYAGRAGARARARSAPIAEPLFNEYLLAFELTSVLLLAAIVGAVVLGKREERADAR